MSPFGDLGRRRMQVMVPSLGQGMGGLAPVRIATGTDCACRPDPSLEGLLRWQVDLVSVIRAGMWAILGLYVGC